MLRTARHAVTLCMLWFGLVAHAEDMCLFDAHIHYSHDAWADYPATAAIERLRPEWRTLLTAHAAASWSAPTPTPLRAGTR